MTHSLLLLALFAQAPPTWEVSGCVRSGDRPLAGIYVSIAGPGAPTRPVRTGESGRYSFRGTAAGVFTIRMEKPEDGGAARPRTVTLGPGDRVDALDLVVAPSFSISGKLTDRDGRPIARTVVVAYARGQKRGQPRLRQTSGDITGSSGEFRISDLPEGDYVVAAAPSVRAPVRVSDARPDALADALPPLTFAPGVADPASAAIVTVGRGAAEASADIAVDKAPNYCISFSAIAPALAEDAQLGVSLYAWFGARGPSLGGGRLAPGRPASLCGLPDGEYRLNLSAVTAQPMRGLGVAEVPVVVARRHVELGVIEILAPRTLAGRVKIAGSDTVPAGIAIGLDLIHRDLMPSDVLSGPVGENGAFQLAGVYPGTYGLRVDNLPKAHYLAAARQQGQDALQAGVQPGDAPLEIQIAADGPRLAGRVLQAGDAEKPLADSTVFLIAADQGTVHVARADQSGRYRFDSAVAPGRYRIAALQHGPEPPEWTPALEVRHAARLAALTLAAGEARTLDLTPID